MTVSLARALALGSLGVALVVGCSGTDSADIEAWSAPGVVDEGSEPGQPPPSGRDGAPDGGSANNPDEPSPDADAGEDAGSKPDASTGVDAGGDSGDPPAPTFPLPARYTSSDDCWQDEFPNATCKPMPKLSPPIVEWECDGTVAVVRVPPQSCARIQGRYDKTKMLSTACMSGTCDHECAQRTNATDEDKFFRIHRPFCAGGVQVNWWPLDECPKRPEGCL